MNIKGIITAMVTPFDEEQNINANATKQLVEKLIAKGYRSPRGFDLGPESVFSIYKKRKIRDSRMNDSMRVEIVGFEVEVKPSKPATPD